jgi:hypothetical protein
LYDAVGAFLDERRVTLPPFGFHQVNRVLSGLAGGEHAAAMATVRSDSEGARYFAYASVIDNRSGDPVFVPAVSGQ